VHGMFCYLLSVAVVHATQWRQHFFSGIFVHFRCAVCNFSCTVRRISYLCVTETEDTIIELLRDMLRWCHWSGSGSEKRWDDGRCDDVWCICHVMQLSCKCPTKNIFCPVRSWCPVFVRPVMEHWFNFTNLYFLPQLFLDLPKLCS